MRVRRCARTPAVRVRISRVLSRFVTVPRPIVTGFRPFISTSLPLVGTGL